MAAIEVECGIIASQIHDANAPVRDVMLTSIAISLKRIADALQAPDAGLNIRDLLSDIATNSGRDRL